MLVRALNEAGQVGGREATTSFTLECEFPTFRLASLIPHTCSARGLVPTLTANWFEPVKRMITSKPPGSFC